MNEEKKDLVGIEPDTKLSEIAFGNLYKEITSKRKIELEKKKEEIIERAKIREAEELKYQKSLDEATPEKRLELKRNRLKNKHNKLIRLANMGKGAS